VRTFEAQRRRQEGTFVPDALLLERFAAGRDESAFAELLARHGPMVLGLCRRGLSCRQDAEDAYQATFLVLARRAGAIAQGERLAGWLCRVACRIATRMRRQRAVRQRHEQSAPRAGPTDRGDDFLAVHEEVQRLPARYRDLVALCYLEGRSHPEAARALGVPLGTVKGWLARARGLLRRRLERRGVALSAGLLAAATGGATAAAVPPTASLSPGVGGRSSDRPAELAQEVLRAMWRAKWQTAAAAILAVVLLGFGAASVAYHALADGPGTKKGKGDAADIQGTWRVVKLAAEGKEQDDDEAKRIKKGAWIIKAGKITVKKADEDSEVTYKLYPQRKPKAIDVTPQTGPPAEKGKLVKGVYELKGDELKICIPAAPGSDRPDAVATKAGSRTMLLVLKRQKARK
jgi:RNA polymerase sigma factor (sigma-70 family)